ncbi:glycosyltransferase family 8 protein [Xylaria cf. heliscus]|nr:glycosyltransferase family 8 protein [Xylaria cf. heliscus]
MAVQGGGGTGGEDVYATLLLTDTYLPGALVLAHSLRDGGTTKKLVVLVTSDTVSAEAITELQSVYDKVIPVSRIRNGQPANLQLMNRTDLHSAFTKIHLWNQTQFRKIVYIDADVVAYRAPDELFDLPHPFSAAPDIGWPDLFNTGVMVLTPNAEDYRDMLALAEQGTSFDGADQGLINTHFGSNYNRISFTYNVTPSAHYQYIPAYRHFQSKINMVHFIGSGKPWFEGRHVSTGSSSFNEMTGKWWAVYDQHYGVGSTQGKVSELVRYLTKGEYQPNGSHKGYHQHHHMSSWDAQRHSPPSGSKPEGMNLPTRVYAMSSSTTRFIAPKQYPSPPSWYNFPKEAPFKPIFPWEANRPKPSRVFDEVPQVPQDIETHDLDALSNEQQLALETESTVECSMTETSSVDQRSEPGTPTTPTIHVSLADPWTSYSRSNAWDEIPEIERYVDSMQRYQRSRSFKSPGTIKVPSPGESVDSVTRPRRQSKLTDFPSEAERPSLPVTPAPIHRSNFWGSGPGTGQGDSDTLLPAAVGVPGQSDWDPVAQLQKLATQHSEELLKKLGGSNIGSKELPLRPIPSGSEALVSPTYVARSAQVLSPQPVKGSAKSSSVLDLVTDDDDEMAPQTPVPLHPGEDVLNEPIPTSKGSASE